jgi:hypothetical protein
MAFSYAHSQKTHETTHTASTRAARAPKITHEATNAGMSAMITQSIILSVVTLPRMCGDTDTESSFIFHRLLRFFLFLCGPLRRLVVIEHQF